MRIDFPDIKQYNERSILICFGKEIKQSLLDKLLTLKLQILKHSTKVKLEVVHSYTSLLVIYPSTIKEFYNEKERLKMLLNSANLIELPQVQNFIFPVCYDESVAPDLGLISQEKQLSEKEIIDLHTASNYQVYLVGFLPGFLYLGGLDKRLKIARKKEPQLNIAPGSVGIGDLQTGIYPKESPGGWQIIGRCPLSFFNPNNNPPMQINPGDQVRFYSVSLEEYRELEATKPAPLLFRKPVGDS